VHHAPLSLNQGGSICCQHGYLSLHPETDCVNNLMWPHVQQPTCSRLAVGLQVPKLRKLLETGHKNGVNDLVWLDAAAAKALEPELRVAAALHSPSTGIVDSHRHALRLELMPV